MTREEAKEKGFTHLSKLYGFRCYTKFLYDEGVEVEGTNWLNKKMIDLFGWLDVEIIQQSEGFEIEILEEL